MQNYNAKKFFKFTKNTPEMERYELINGDPKKISKKRINGAPEFVIEIVGESNSALDYFYKLFTYMKYGVKEYWIVNPVTKNILVYINGEEIKTASYTFEDKIKVSIFEDFEIDFKELRI